MDVAGDCRARGLLLGGIRLLHHAYDEERIQVMTLLEGGRGIADLEVRGWDDITYEVHGVKFGIVGRPDAVIVIQRPEEGLAGAPEHLRIERLGPWQFHECSDGYQGVFEGATGKPVESLGYLNSIDIGPLGEFGAMLPVKVRDVNDVVAHDDELVRYFSTWPDEKTWGRLDNPSGRKLAYCRVPAPGPISVPHPPNFP